MMFRKMGLVVALLIAATWMGCRSCGAPYDRCQPTFVPEKGDQCLGELYRAGSVLGGMKRTQADTGGCKSCQGNSTSSPAPEEEIYGETPMDQPVRDSSTITPGGAPVRSITPSPQPAAAGETLAPYGAGVPMDQSMEEFSSEGTLLHEGEFILSE